MKTKHFFRLGLALILTLTSLNINAQENKEAIKKAGQFTFIYPLGTNGTSSKDISNIFSLNAIIGINGGLHTGAELGGVINYNNGDVTGLQMAGVSNINRKESNGVFLSGVANISGKSLSGAAISGVLNMAGGNSNGVHASTINIAAKEFSGIQLGVINTAGKLKGLQLGVINVVKDGDEGVPIGLINIVKNGYHEFEVVASDLIYANLSFKMGVEKFYTIFKTGFSTQEGNAAYSAGIGFGSLLPLSNNHKLSLDLSMNTITDNFEWEEHWFEDVDILYKADLNYRYALSEKLSLIAGPSFNLYYSEPKIDSNNPILNIPYTIKTTESNNGNYNMWIGLNAGFSFRL
ncbi:MAG: hypothetical protein HN352_05900 [Bacteroidetes bacterium]|jgi:hypothetical protein|nr:hypothetical protein [Bacteroidota bacterium]MBT4410674.1 hypothetical protein [Bacteroidota bacterium]MBT6046676.1 hypothetical protein [Candidatus Scalindua sp.]MBT7464263.1 hypothetical protein [Bacteroidota bacterium]MBT7827192.1 hypothetical protein [Bacteroidota bacterium]